jgi:hypothetical protein
VKRVGEFEASVAQEPDTEVLGCRYDPKSLRRKGIPAWNTRVDFGPLPELDHDSVVAFFATTAADGKIYQVECYNLDAIISSGYRANLKSPPMGTARV